jgi:hypothetical protein
VPTEGDDPLSTPADPAPSPASGMCTLIASFWPPRRAWYLPAVAAAAGLMSPVIPIVPY